MEAISNVIKGSICTKPKTADEMLLKIVSALSVLCDETGNADIGWKLQGVFDYYLANKAHPNQ